MSKKLKACLPGASFIISHPVLRAADIWLFKTWKSLFLRSLSAERVLREVPELSICRNRRSQKMQRVPLIASFLVSLQSGRLKKQVVLDFWIPLRVKETAESVVFSQARNGQQLFSKQRIGCL